MGHGLCSSSDFHILQKRIPVILDQVLVRFFAIMASHMGRQSGFICRRKITLITIEYFTANMNLSAIVISIINTGIRGPRMKI